MPKKKKPITITGASVGADVFDDFANNGHLWFDKGVSLLRASRAIMRQVKVDQAKGLGDTFLLNRRPPDYAKITLPALFLAALAVENGLKGAIVANCGVVKGGKLPNVLTGHNLATLAKDAHVNPVGDEERNALDEGQRIIESMGRYPVPKHSGLWTTHSSVDVDAVWLAFWNLVFRAAEVEARGYHGRWASLQARPVDDYVRERLRWLQTQAGGIPQPRIITAVGRAAAKFGMWISGVRQNVSSQRSRSK
jgi:hypothetical protein